MENSVLEVRSTLNLLKTYHQPLGNQRERKIRGRQRRREQQKTIALIIDYKSSAGMKRADRANLRFGSFSEHLWFL